MQYIERKSLLYRSEVEYADFCINHIEGCSHGCKYPCYAFMLKKRWGVIDTYKDWCEPKLVINAIELLDNEIVKYKDKIKHVHLCFSSDPFMYKQKEVCDMSSQIINKLNEADIKCTVLTKGTYPLGMLSYPSINGMNEYGISLVSLSESFRKKFEPHTSPMKRRVEALRKLSDRGLTTWVSIEPYPTPNIIEQDLDMILERVSFVNKIIFGKLNYSKSTSDYRKKKEFYHSAACRVIDFCDRKSIAYHIKKGTM